MSNIKTHANVKRVTPGAILITYTFFSSRFTENLNYQETLLSRL